MFLSPLLGVQRVKSGEMGGADVLIILEDSPLKVDERIPALMPSGIGVGVDVFPYTLREATQALEGGWGVVRIALQEGVFLFARDEKLAELFRVQRRVDDQPTKMG